MANIKISEPAKPLSYYTDILHNENKYDKVSNYSTHTMRVLIIDNDTVSGRIMLSQLGYLNIFDLKLATTARIEQIHSFSPHLIIMDINLSEISGLDLILNLRLDSTVFKTPIIVVSALDPSYHEASALNAGANIYIKKPYKTELLLKEVLKAVSS